MAGQAAKHLEEGVQAIVIMQQSASPDEQMETKCNWGLGCGKDGEEVEGRAVVL